MSAHGTNDEAKTKKYDALVIPGGGLEPHTSLPQPWVRARLDTAYSLSAQTIYFIVLSRGTTHKSPPRDSRGFPIDEASASAKYLMNLGIESDRILLDGWSLDTIGNAYFARRMICDPLQLQKLCIITSSFHMLRTRTIFEWVFALDGCKSTLDFCVTPDVGLNDAQSSARIDKEKSSIRSLRENIIPNISTMQALSLFVLQKHAAYNAESTAAIKFSNGDGMGECGGSKDSNIQSTY